MSMKINRFVALEFLSLEENFLIYHFKSDESKWSHKPIIFWKFLLTTGNYLWPHSLCMIS
jgi:hypothetical protein